MEVQDFAVWAAIGTAALALAVLAFGRRGSDVGAVQLAGRLDQLAAQQAAAQNALSERLQAQERALATKLERLIDQAPAVQGRQVGEPEDARAAERRLGALLAAAREGRAERVPFREPPAAVQPRRLTVEDDLFEDDPLILDAPRGARR